MQIFYSVLVRALCFLTAIPFHEAAHAYVSDRLGDPTAKNMGRMTLNPIAHFDPLGALCMLFTGIGWAKPVPINTYNFSNRKKGMMLSAAAGPLSNILLAFILLVLGKIVLYAALSFGGVNGVVYTVYDTITAMVRVNIYLAVFNLMPFPPFDGSRIAAAVLPQPLYFKIMEYERYIFLVVLALLIFGVFDTPLAFVSSALIRALNYATGFVDLIFSVL